MQAYFLSPFLLKGIKNIKISATLFIIVSLARILVEYFVKNGEINLFPTYLYFGPIIRLLEFYLGMLMIPLFFYLKTKQDKIAKYKKILEFLYTIIQIFAPIQQYLIMRKYNYIYSSFHVIYCCFFLFIIANDYGFLSNNFFDNNYPLFLLNFLSFPCNLIFQQIYYLYNHQWHPQTFHH